MVTYILTMESPYKFDPSNHRLVSNVRNDSTKISVTAGLLYAASMYKYHRRFLRVDGNGMNAVFFAIASLPASYAYARFIWGSAENEAAQMNNARE